MGQSVRRDEKSCSQVFFQQHLGTGPGFEPTPCRRFFPILSPLSRRYPPRKVRFARRIPLILASMKRISRREGGHNLLS